MDKMGDSSAVLSPANRRVHSNPFGSIEPKPYGLPERNEPDLGWFATARRHQFLLFMLAILTFLCTIYLYFAITFGADTCAGLRGPQKAACRIARANANIGHRRLLSDGRFAVGTSDWEYNALPYVAGFLGKLRLATAGRRVERLESRLSSLVEQNMKRVSEVMDMDQGARSFADVIKKNYPVWVRRDTPTFSVQTGDDWCVARQSSLKAYDLVHGYGIIASQINRCQINDILSKVNSFLQPGGYFIIWDRADLIEVAVKLAPSLEWTTIARYTSSKSDEAIVAFRSPKGLRESAKGLREPSELVLA